MALLNVLASPGLLRDPDTVQDALKVLGIALVGEVLSDPYLAITLLYPHGEWSRPCHGFV